MSEPFVGEIKMVGFNYAPRNWAFCDGQILPIDQNQMLYALLGTTYGGDGRSTLALPDLRGRVPVHEGAGPGLSSYYLGQKGGYEQVTLNQAQIPAHTHSAKLRAHNGGPDTTDVEGNALGVSNDDIYTDNDPDVDMRAGSVTEQSVGGGQAHTNMQPFLCVNFVIALTGIFPSRN